MVSLEAFVLWNFAMDALLCAAAATACSREGLRSSLAAAALGAGYALAARTGPAWLGDFPAAAAVGAAMALIAARPESLAQAGRAIGALYAASLFVGGARLLAANAVGGAAGMLCSALAGVGLFVWLGRSRRARIATWDVLLFLRTSSGCVRFRALVDTGNRLHEPISGLPVMIVEEKALRRALPDGLDAHTAAQKLPAGWRLVRYGVLGSAGTMACFRPQRLLVSYGGKWLLAPDIWVAVYPGRIPGQVAALAPTVLGTIEPAAAARGIRQKRWA